MNPRPDITSYPVAETAENRDLGKGSPNITISGSLETVGTGILI